VITIDDLEEGEWTDNEVLEDRAESTLDSPLLPQLVITLLQMDNAQQLA